MTGRNAPMNSKLKVLLCEALVLLYIRLDWRTPSSDKVWDAQFMNFNVYMNDGFEGLTHLPEQETRKLLTTRRLWPPELMGGDEEDDVATFMMTTPGSKKRGRDGAGKADGNDKAPKKPRQQKQPNGNAFRRRAKARRRSLRERLAEKCVVNPDRAFGYQREKALGHEVRRIFDRRPLNSVELGLSNREAQRLEVMLRSDGAWGLTIVLASCMEVLASLASDIGVLAHIVAMDLEEPHHYEEVRPLPEEDLEVPEDEVPIEVRDGDDDDGSCAAASSGRPPRRRRAGRLDGEDASRSRVASACKPRDKKMPKPPANKSSTEDKEGGKDKRKSAEQSRNIATAPWRQPKPNPRDKWLIKAPSSGAASSGHLGK